MILSQKSHRDFIVLDLVHGKYCIKSILDPLHHEILTRCYFSAAYESIMELLKSSPRDCYAVVQETTVTIIARLEDLLHHRQSSNEKTSGGNYNDLQSLLCATLQVILAILNINVCV